MTKQRQYSVFPSYPPQSWRSENRQLEFLLRRSIPEVHRLPANRFEVVARTAYRRPYDSRKYCDRLTDSPQASSLAHDVYRKFDPSQACAPHGVSHLLAAFALSGSFLGLSLEC